MLREFAAWKKQSRRCAEGAGRAERRSREEEGERQAALAARAGSRGASRRCSPPAASSAAVLGHLLRRDHGDQRRRRQDLDRVAAARRLRQHPARGARTQGRDARRLHARERRLQEDSRLASRRTRARRGARCTSIDLPNPGSGLDAVRLAERQLAAHLQRHESRAGHSLAVSLSDDEGKTWKWTRHLEKHDERARTTTRR